MPGSIFYKLVWVRKDTDIPVEVQSDAGKDKVGLQSRMTGSGTHSLKRFLTSSSSTPAAITDAVDIFLSFNNQHIFSIAPMDTPKPLGHEMSSL